LVKGELTRAAASSPKVKHALVYLDPSKRAYDEYFDINMLTGAFFETCGYKNAIDLLQLL
jgi:hypothetical protein